MQVSGAPSLPPLAALGVWYSRYFPYGAHTYFANVIDEYASHDLPLSVGVLDVPWHTIDFPPGDLPPDKNSSENKNNQGAMGGGVLSCQWCIVAELYVGL